MLRFAILLSVIKTIILQETLPHYSFFPSHLNETVTQIINFSSTQVFCYKLDDDFVVKPSDTNIRIDVTVHSRVSIRTCPVLFTVKERQSVVSWELPVEYSYINGDGNMVYDYHLTAGRTLCIDKNRDTISQALTVTVSTCSATNIEFSLSVGLYNNLVVHLDEKLSGIKVYPTEPVYYRFDYKTSDLLSQYLMIQLNSLDKNDLSCAILSIQKPTCPIYDQEFNIQFQGYWQSLTTAAAITIRKSDFEDGFFIVLVVLNDNRKCSDESGIFELEPRTSTWKLNNKYRNKTFTLVVKNIIEPSEYILPILAPLGMIFGLILLILVVFSIFQHLLVKNISATQEANIEFMKSRIAKFRSQLSIYDLMEKNLEEIQRQSNRYYWSIVTIGIFYCVPVFQLITNYLKMLYKTGEYDLCYYNYLCARPLGRLVDFNHIYSNIGYIIFGITFMVIVRIRQASLSVAQTIQNATEDQREAVDSIKIVNTGYFRKIFPQLITPNCQYGTVQQYGIFYALGVALVLEGILSASYHICPNQSNFQFDTSFMYVIAVLGIVKVYQFRHPFYLSANITFISLAFLAASSVIGLLFNSLVFKICFSVFHLVGMLLLLLYLYNIGYFTEDGTVVTSWVGVYKALFGINTTYERPRSSTKRSRLILPILTLSLNILIIVLMWTIMSSSNFATQLLAIFVANFSAYTIYYGLMKLLHKEYKSKCWIQLLIYGILALGLWILSLNYFRSAQSSWDVTPAESRTMNNECAIWDFYDKHDQWHFTSAAALLCSFMLLLTIDDDLLTAKQEDIPVF